jgi:hypothetical protein
MKVRASLVFTSLLAAGLLVAINLPAQSQEKGISFYEEYRGSSNDLGQVTVLDSSVGYNFNRHFGMDVGIPVYFVHPAQDSLTNWRTWNNNFGDAYLDARFHAPTRFVNYNSIITGGAPTGSFARGFSTGRATVDWDNHFDRHFGPITPFLDASLGNSLADRHFFTRPFRTLGFVSESEGGATYRVWRFFHVGASYYDVLPSGTQKVYSQVFQREPFLTPVQANHGRVFETAFDTTGPASLVRDNGYTGWVGVSPIHNLNLEVGYNHSVRYALDTVSFRVGVNAGNVVRSLTNRF